MDRLWKEMGRTDGPPEADVQAVKRRVHRALDADPTERKVYMRQKVRLTLAAAALAAAVTGSALAVTANLDVLQAFFRGDTTPAQEYVDQTARTVRDENYTLTVESSVADENTAYLVMTVKALNDESRARLFSDGFVHMDTFHVQPLNADGTLAEDWISGVGMGEIKEKRTGDSISWGANVDLTGPIAALRLRLDDMAEDKAVEVPLTPAPSVTVEVGAAGVGIPDFYTQVPGTLTVERVTLTPFTCKVETADEPITYGFETDPRIFFRMADGSIRTQSQMMEVTGSSVEEETVPGGPDESTLGRVAHNYRFKEVQDLAQIKSVLVFDREFPLDGSASSAVAHDPALDPFQLPLMAALSEENGGYSIPVQALIERLGGACARDPATGVVTCTYRGVTVVLTPGSDTAVINGQPVAMLEAPAVQSGALCADCDVFFDAWGLDAFVMRSKQGDEVVCRSWYILP